ncbi:MAG: hypothetical protein JRN23_04305 [Nitrososphaerota archaeon]|nr:hypothetical protein [Nitrososphaerota archaeon]
MNLAVAEELAKQLADLLRPFCERIEVAGGIRRRKPDPHDIELVAVPKLRKEIVSTPLGTTVESGRLVNTLDERVRLLELLLSIERDDPVQQVRRSRTGVGTETVLIRAPFSEKYYRFKFRGEKADLFVVTPPAQWGATFAIRTGDAEFSHRLVQQGYAKGLHEHAGHLERWRDRGGALVTSIYPVEGMSRETIDTPEEADYFAALGVPYVEPELRVTTETSVKEWEATAR